MADPCPICETRLVWMFENRDPSILVKECKACKYIQVNVKGVRMSVDPEVIS